MIFHLDDLTQFHVIYFDDKMTLFGENFNILNLATILYDDHVVDSNPPMRGSASFAPYTSVSKSSIVVTKQIGNPWRCLECGLIAISQ
jgi:hypothetical protein